MMVRTTLPSMYTELLLPPLHHVQLPSTSSWGKMVETMCPEPGMEACLWKPLVSVTFKIH